jgi:isopenicillin-N epimerase
MISEWIFMEVTCTSGYVLPREAGFLYARPEAQYLLKLLVVSWGYEAEVPGLSRFIDQHEWIGTRDIAAFLSVPAAIEFQCENDREKAWRASHELLCEAQDRICIINGTPPVIRHLMV